MRLGELFPEKGAKKKKKRVGRGNSSGQGGTSGRGHKGQLSRSGGGTRPGFEGGQMPLYRRLPKRGTFKNYPFKQEYKIINIEDLNQFKEGEVVNSKKLAEAGYFKGKREKLPLKVLGEGELKKPLTVEAHRFSESAKRKIEEAKGKAVLIKEKERT